MVGYSNKTLAGLPDCKAGDVIPCPGCGGEHALIGTGQHLVLVFVCQGRTCLGGVAGKLVVGIDPDISESRRPVVLCDACYAQRQPGRQPPVRVKEPKAEPCFECGAMTTSGIYVPRPREKAS